MTGSFERPGADGVAVPGATVALVGSDLRVTTDNDGRYSIELPQSFVRAGKVQLRVDALGMPAKAYDVELTPNGPTTFNVAVRLGVEELVTVKL